MVPSGHLLIVEAVVILPAPHSIFVAVSKFEVSFCYNEYFNVASSYSAETSPHSIRWLDLMANW